MCILTSVNTYKLSNGHNYLILAGWDSGALNDIYSAADELKSIPVIGGGWGVKLKKKLLCYWN